MSNFIKDPDAILDYKVDWSEWLDTDETISTQTTLASTGITVESSGIFDSSTSVVAWLSGGTANSRYRITSRITTSAGRTDDRSYMVSIKER